MSKFTKTMICSGLLALSAQAFAAEPVASNSKNNTVTQTPEQKARQEADMKGCMAEKKAAGSTLSVDEMTKTCRTEMKIKHDAMMKKAEGGK